MPAFDVDALRAEFPALAREQDGRPVAFLDGPGGTQVPQRVIDAVVAYYRDSNANTDGAFVTSRLSDAIVAEAHAAVADFLGAGSPEEIKFGQNMTSLTLHIGRSIGATLGPGDEILVTTLDHEANVSTWRAMAADRGVTVQTVDIHEDDVTLDIEDLESKLSPRTKLVAVGYASNAVGSVNPVKEIVARAHEVGAMTYVDAVAFAPHGPIESSTWTPTSSPAPRTSGSGRTLACCTARPRSSTPAGVQGQAGPRPGRDRHPVVRVDLGHARRDRLPARRRARVRRRGRCARRGRCQRAPPRAGGRDGRDRRLRTRSSSPGSSRASRASRA